MSPARQSPSIFGLKLLKLPTFSVCVMTSFVVSLLAGIHAHPAIMGTLSLHIIVNPFTPYNFPFPYELVHTRSKAESLSVQLDRLGLNSNQANGKTMLHFSICQALPPSQSTPMSMHEPFYGMPTYLTSSPSCHIRSPSCPSLHLASIDFSSDSNCSHIFSAWYSQIYSDPATYQGVNLAFFKLFILHWSRFFTCQLKNRSPSDQPGVIELKANPVRIWPTFGPPPTFHAVPAFWLEWWQRCSIIWSVW